MRHEVSAIGVTGQMHSVLLGRGQQISPLITWQDHRCGEAALKRFSQKAQVILREGFGGATLARLAEAGQLAQWEFAATIGDYLVQTLTGNDVVVTDPTHAASWGLYDNAAGRVERDGFSLITFRRFYRVEPGKILGVTNVIC
ncbi:MAG: FGGY family carbohydrate kinase [Victivallaceae bacterium]|nr:FGGY family carbohydrate kinase [Victivallaceae bacterium]